jgi:hypothetical protein
MTFEQLFAKLKRNGLIPSRARPSVYRLFWMLGRGDMALPTTK